MSFDYSKLKGKITERYGTRSKFAEALGVSQRTLSLKLNNHTPWTNAEMVKAMDLLKLRNEDVSDYFFTEKVQGFEL